MSMLKLLIKLLIIKAMVLEKLQRALPNLDILGTQHLGIC